MNNWINDFKLAFINEDIEKIIKISAKFSEQNFENLDQMQEAQALITQAIELLGKKSQHIQNELTKLQKAQKYIKN